MLRWLFEAIKSGERKENTLKFIREHFEEIHELTDGSQRTLLHIAANHRNLDVVEFMFSLY